jgi:pimeloyl-ACP methyl ester carboxylesterase
MRSRATLCVVTPIARSGAPVETRQGARHPPRNSVWAKCGILFASRASATTVAEEGVIMDRIRRKILKTGAAAAAMAAAPRVFAQQGGQEGAARFYEKGAVRIRYDETGSGFPLLLIAGGGLNSTMDRLPGSPFDPIAEFKNEYRCIYADLRNADTGQSSGPLEIDRPWDSYTDDHVGLMDHLGIDKFMVLGFCIGGPFIWNILERAPDRVVAAVLAQPVGFRPEAPTVMYDSGVRGWGPALVKRRPEITTDMVEKFLTRMYRTGADFTFTVTRDFVRNCQTPVLILPDDSAAHPYAVAMECAMLAPKAEVSMFPWKEPVERIPLAVRQIRSFLRAHRVAST